MIVGVARVIASWPHQAGRSLVAAAAGMLLLLPACADSANANDVPVHVATSVLDLSVSGAWKGAMASPRSLKCDPTGAYGGLAANWVGTLGQRLVRLVIIDNSLEHYPGTVPVPGQDSSGALQNPDIGYGVVEDTVLVHLTDLRSTELHTPGGSLTVNPDKRSGSLDLHDKNLRVVGTWRC
jgi:hypothetical protein